MLNISSNWLEQALARGREAQAAGRLGEAAEIYTRVLSISPGHVEAMHLLGKVCFGMGQKERAVELFRGVVESAAGSADGWNSLGLGLLAVGKSAEAEEALRKSLALDGSSGAAWSNLGIALKNQGKIDEAIDCYREAVRLSPGLADAQNNLGNALRDRGDLDEAVAAFRRAVILIPDFAEVWNNLGLTLGILGRGEEAVGAFEEAIRLRPGAASADFHVNLGQQLRLMGRSQEAIAACQRGVQMGSRFAAGHLMLSCLLEDGRRSEEAAEVLRQGVERFPSVEALRLALARLTGDREIRTLPAGVVAGLFESYVPQFENHLVKQLDYRGPELLFEAIAAVGAGERRFDILDVGCGTGLCGERFKPLARRMVGVDIAAGMVKRAAARGIYEEVMVGEMLAVMNSRPAEFDLLLAGDVLEYVGALEEVLAAARRALHEGGLFAFTVEKSDAGELEFRSTLRFAHSIGYVRRLSAEHGFVEMYAQERMLRLECQKPLAAWVVVLRKA